MSNIVGTYNDPRNTPTPIPPVRISPGPMINGTTIYPMALQTTTDGVTNVDLSLYFVPMPNQPGSYLLYRFPDATNPVGAATLNGNTLTLSSATYTGNTLTFSDSFTLQKTGSVPVNLNPPTQVLANTNAAIAAQSTLQTNPNMTPLSPATMTGMRVEEPQHTKIKHHRRGKKAGKRKH